jgi:electron transfer flavoprotein alpha subunit
VIANKRMGIKIDVEKCVGCGLCAKACSRNAIEIIDKKAVIDSAACDLCAACVDACRKYGAITITRESTAGGADVSRYRNVAVFIEQRNGAVSDVSYEMLGEGRKLADRLGEKLTAVLLGKAMQQQAGELAKYGADTVYYMESDELAVFSDERYATIVSDFIFETKPSVFLAGATAAGRSFIPKVAARVCGGLTADCTGLEIDLDKRILLGTRPAFGGNLMATIICPRHRPQMATVRHKVMKPAVRDEKRSGELVVRKFEKGTPADPIRFIEFVKESGSTVNISEADIIVAGGRGMGKPENFSLLRELAEVLGGAVGASRAAVDAGWIPYSHQVGQTGKTVCPKLYIACGISGSVQHMAGMQSSGHIIAINRDPAADIFQIADLGVVGDISQVVPALTRAFKEKLST